MPPKKTPASKAPATSGQTADLDLIRSLAGILNETGLSEIELDQRGTRVRVSKASSSAVFHSPVMHAAPPAAQPAVSHAPVAEAKPAAAADAEHAGTVKSPMVGTAYLAPTPGAARFVEVGQEVKAGQTLLIIEAMKTMNQIHSPAAGKIIRIHVENGDPVEFGAPLVTIE
jgi:acetyl-CoA carboxylase biotin carboxyl carrier protein